MKTKIKSRVGFIAIIMSIIMLAVIIVNDHNAISVTQKVRTIELSQMSVDVQSVFDEFDNATLTRNGSTVYFDGEKLIDTSSLSTIDYINDVNIEELEECTVKYSFSYDTESNIVVLSAKAILPDGTISIDEVRGVGFINETGEIDAVMNIDGEGILLSEMRSAGMIENCGWFSKLIKKVAKVVAVVAVAVVAVAAVVVTAGAAAPAVVAAGLGVSTTVVASTVATAATIGAYACITAAIASGVAITASMWEQAYPGIDITVTNNQTRAKWDEKTKAAVRDIAIAETSKKQDEQKIYLFCVAGNCVPKYVDLSIRYTCNEMASMMRMSGASSVTSNQSAAHRVISTAAGRRPIIEEAAHYHAVDIFNSNYSSSRPLKNNPRWAVGGFTIHSFWTV